LRPRWLDSAWGEAHGPLAGALAAPVNTREGVSRPAASLVLVLLSGGMGSLPEGFAVTLRCGVGAGPLTDTSQMLKVFTDGYILHGDGDKVLSSADYRRLSTSPASAVPSLTPLRASVLHIRYIQKLSS